MQAEARLQQTDIKALLDSLPLGVALLDPDNRVITLNRYLEALTGYNRAEASGVAGASILRAHMREGRLEDAAGKDAATVLEGDCIDAGRRRLPVRITVTPLPGAGGAVLALEDLSLLRELDSRVHGLAHQGKLLGHSPKMQSVLEFLPVVAKTDASVLITGETGTGKDLAAEAIHQESRRAQAPFIKVNCGALPEALLESELFGHSRGAFTGADRDKPGMFRLADGGTLFLTEIGDLPLPLQVKLLTVLDDREFFPVGGTRKVKVDVRVIAATHRDLATRVREGTFREDLYFRLNVLRLHLPPLREREGDVELLGNHFLKESAAALGKAIRGFSRPCRELLRQYPFPGNVRELRNIVEHAVHLCPGGLLEVEHLPASLLEARSAAEADGEARGGASASFPHPEAGVETAEGPRITAVATGWSQVERQMILDALMATGGRRQAAAKRLGWARTKLWRKMKRYGLDA